MIFFVVLIVWSIMGFFLTRLLTNIEDTDIVGAWLILFVSGPAFLVLMLFFTLRDAANTKVKNK